MPALQTCLVALAGGPVAGFWAWPSHAAVRANFGLQCYVPLGHVPLGLKQHGPFRCLQRTECSADAGMCPRSRFRAGRHHEGRSATRFRLTCSRPAGTARQVPDAYPHAAATLATGRGCLPAEPWPCLHAGGPAAAVGSAAAGSGRPRESATGDVACDCARRTLATSLQARGSPSDVIGHEGRDEEVRVVVALAHVEGQGDTGLLAGLFQQPGA